MINYPFGNADEQDLGTGGTVAVTVGGQFTILKSSSVESAMTINATIGSGVKKGAVLIVDVQQDAAAGDNVTFGTGMTGQAITGVASDRDVAMFYYDGTTFVKYSEEKAVDAA